MKLKVTPLTLSRAKHLLEKKSGTDTSLAYASQVLDALLDDVESPFILSDVTSTIISLIKDRKQYKDLILRYEDNLKFMLNLYGVQRVSQITPDYIVYYFDRLIKSLDIENPTADKAEVYVHAYNIVMNRDLSLWAIAGKLSYIQTDIVGSLYSIETDLLTFHDQHKIQHLRDIMLYKWEDSSFMNQWQYHLDKCKLIVQGLGSVKEADTGIDDTLCGLSERESYAYWEIRWWLIYAMFLKGEFESVVDQFWALVNEDRSTHGVVGGSIEVLKELDSTIIDGESLIKIVLISLVLSKNNLTINEMLSSGILMDSIYDDPTLKQFKKAMDCFQYPEVLDLLCKLESKIPWCGCLHGSFERIATLLLEKSLLSYLSVVDCVSFGELSYTFDRPKDYIIQLVERLVILLDLPLFIDEEEEIVRFKQNQGNYEMSFIREMGDVVNSELIRVRCLKQESLNSKFKDEDKQMKF